MKFNRIKQLVSILLIAFASCNSLLRKTEESSKSLSFASLEAKLHSSALVTADGGSWKDGFNCPKIVLTLNGGKEENLGAALIQGAKLFDKTQENESGLVLQFATLPKKNSNLYAVAVQADPKVPNKFYIPWRYFRPTFRDTNPLFDNKYTEGNLVSDFKAQYNFRINFPYKLIGSYISTEELNKINKRLNDKANEIGSKIRVDKETLNTLYPKYENNLMNIDKISKGAKAIDLQIATINAKMSDWKKQKEMKVASLENLEKQYQIKYIDSQFVFNNMAKIKKEITEANANMNALMVSIKSLENSKANPSSEIAKVKKDQEEITKKVEGYYNVLKSSAPDMEKTILESKTGFQLMDRKRYITNLEKFIP